MLLNMMMHCLFTFSEALTSGSNGLICALSLLVEYALAILTNSAPRRPLDNIIVSRLPTALLVISSLVTVAAVVVGAVSLPVSAIECRYAQLQEIDYAGKNRHSALLLSFSTDPGFP